MYKNAVVVMMILGLMAVASCSGGAAPSLDSEPQNTSTVQTPAPQADEDLTSSTQWTPLVTDKPIIPSKDASWDLPEFPEIDWDSIWDSMHQDVQHGDNELDLSAYMSHSDNAQYYNVLVGVTPDLPPTLIYNDFDVFGSTENSLAHMTYGMKNFPAGEELKQITIEGSGIGVYVGIADYNNHNYRWFGKYDLGGGPVTIDLPLMDSVNNDGKAYLVFASYNGEQPVIQKVTYKVGDQLPIGPWEVPDFEVPDFGPWI
jgi:hypothetical protein